MPVRVEQKGPIAVYLFRRKRDDCVTQEMPAIILPDEPQPSSQKDPMQEQQASSGP